MPPKQPEISRFNVAACRAQFPSLRRELRGTPVAYFDGPGGTQVPQRVIDALVGYLSRSNANLHGEFVTSRESDETLADAHQAAADFFGTGDPGEVYFGPNMTTLTLALSRAIARTWQPGDELLVTRLDHDANITPWVLAARDAGVVVRHVGFQRENGTLDLDDLDRQLNKKTRLVAVGVASNALGTLNPVAEICRRARSAGALVFLDAVHSAVHTVPDVVAWDCDFCACSAYKFFGPHVGMMFGRRRWLEELAPYKLRVASDALPDRWMTGTQNHEGLAGLTAAIDYLAEVGRRERRLPPDVDRRAALLAASDVITDYEQILNRRLLQGLAALESVRLFGITAPQRLKERVPTFALTHARLTPRELARRLGEQGLFVWDGNFYALAVTEALGLEPQGLLRIGAVHYNTTEEIDRLIGALESLE